MLVMIFYFHVFSVCGFIVLGLSMWKSEEASLAWFCNLYAFSCTWFLICLLPESESFNAIEACLALAALSWTAVSRKSAKNTGPQRARPAM